MEDSSWAAFCLDEASFVRYRLFLSEQDSDAKTRFRPSGYEPPQADELVHIPWRGEGPDPLKGL